MGPMTSPPDPRPTGVRPRSSLPLPVVALCLTGLLSGLLSGCGGDTSSAGEGDAPGSSQGSSQATTDVDVTVDGDTISPTNQEVRVGVGGTVDLHVTSDRAGELHVHASPEQELAFGQGTTDLTVTLDKPGSVDVEEHETETLVLRILVS